MEIQAIIDSTIENSMVPLTLSDSIASPLNPQSFSLSQINTSGNKSGSKSIYTNGLRGSEFVDMIRCESSYKPRFKAKDPAKSDLLLKKYLKVTRRVLIDHGFYKSHGKITNSNFTCKVKNYNILS